HLHLPLLLFFHHVLLLPKTSNFHSSSLFFIKHMYPNSPNTSFTPLILIIHSFLFQQWKRILNTLLPTLLVKEYR
ncbi:hypothetical protein VIGAN_08119700, partial [Vigna angularis var. angularis]